MQFEVCSISKGSNREPAGLLPAVDAPDVTRQPV